MWGWGEASRRKQENTDSFIPTSTIIIAFLLAHFFNAHQAANFHKFYASFSRLFRRMSVKGGRLKGKVRKIVCNHFGRCRGMKTKKRFTRQFRLLFSLPPADSKFRNISICIRIGTKVFISRLKGFLCGNLMRKFNS